MTHADPPRRGTPSSQERRRLYQRLRTVEARLDRFGLQLEAVIGACDHEITALSTLPTGDHVWILVGTRGGGCYLGRVEAPRSGDDPPPARWGRLGSVGEGLRGHDVSTLVIFGQDQALHVAVGTDHNGLWWSRLPADPWAPRALQAIPATSGASISALLHDAPSGRLLAGSPAGALYEVGGLDDGAAPPTVRVLPMTWGVSAMTVGPGDSPAHDVLYLATSAGDLHTFPRDVGSGAFALDEARLHGPPLFRSPGGGFHQLLPLPPGRWGADGGAPGGVIGLSLRMAHGLFRRHGAPGGTRQIRLPMSQAVTLLRGCHGAFSDQGFTLLAGLDGRLYLILSEGDGSASDEVEGLFSGGVGDLDLGYRAAGLAVAPRPPGPGPTEGAHWIVTAGSDQRVRLYLLENPRDLEAQASQLQQRLVSEEAPGAVIGWMRDRLAHSPFDPLTRSTLVALLPEALRRLDPGQGDAQWRCLVHELLFLAPDREALAAEMIGALRTATLLNPRLVEAEHALTRHILTFVIDGPSHSLGPQRRLELVDLHAATHPDAALVYGSILAERGYDPLFTRTFSDADAFGEVVTFTPLLRTHNHPPWWRDLPGDPALFLSSTHRGGMWLMDTHGEALHLRAPAGWGLLQNVYFSTDAVLLSYDDGSLRSVRRQDLQAVWAECRPRGTLGPVAPVPEATTAAFTTELLPRPAPQAGVPVDRPAAGRLCFCPVPDADRWEDGSCLVGDVRGRLWLRRGAHFRLLGDLFEQGEDGPVQQGLQDLRSSWMTGRDGGRIPLIIASTTAGDVHLFRWTPTEPPSLVHQDACYIDRTPVSMLSWPRPDTQTLVASSEEGKVQCLRILEEPLGRLRLRRAWTYHTGARLNDLHEHSYRGSPVVIVGSHDRRFHILDMQGHLLETVLVPHVPLHRFCVTDPDPEEQAQGVVCQVFACGFENVYAGLRLLDTPTLTRRLTDLTGEPDEEALLRWRGIEIREHHLRVRHCRFSHTWEEAFPHRLLQGVSQLLDRDEQDEVTTRLLCALLQRLFQRRLPGVPRQGGEPLRGLGALLRDPPAYGRVHRLLGPLRARWGLPNSQPNRKIQLYWVRSVLRAVETLEDLRRWRAVGEACAAETGLELADPKRLLWEFLSSPAAILQYKTLQYLERTLLGWVLSPAEGRRHGPAVLLDPDVQPADIEWVVDLLISRLLWKQRREIQAAKPYWIVVEVARLLREMLRHGLIDPLWLAHTVERRGVSAEFLEIMGEQIEAALAEPSGGPLEHLRRASELLPACAEILHDLHDPSVTRARLIRNLIRVRDYADSRLAADPPADPIPERLRGFLLDMISFAGRAVILLSGDHIEDLRGVQELQLRQPSATGTLWAAFEAWASFVEAVHRYDKARMVDIEGDPFRGLSVAVFQGMVSALDDVASRLEAGGEHAWEQAILRRARRHWTEVIEEERESRLLADFIAALKKTVLAPGDGGDALTAARAAEAISDAQAQRTLALENLFLRLILFAQPDEGFMLGQERGADGRRLVQRYVAAPPGADRGPQAEPRRVDEAALPPELREVRRLASLTPEDIEASLHQQAPARQEWIVETMTSRSSGPLEVQGFIALAWDREASAGRRRYVRHRLICTLLIEALSLKQVQIEQRAFVGRFFSMVAHNLRNPAFNMRSGLGNLRAGWLEDQPQQKRLDYYEQMYRQAAHMQAIVESILRFRGQNTQPPRLARTEVAAVILDAVKACRQEFRARRMEIHFEAEAAAGIQWDVDEGWLYEIVQILLLNALKYSPPGETVDVSVGASRRGLEIAVTDKGPGVPRDERKDIFKPFHRGRYAEEHGIPGLGLGLYIAKEYAEAMGGRLQYRDNPSGGSIFILFLHAPEQVPF